MANRMSYPTVKVSKKKAALAAACNDATAAGMVGILHNMVLSAEDPNEDPSHRQWCAGQAAMFCSRLDIRFPRGGGVA